MTRHPMAPVVSPAVRTANRRLALVLSSIAAAFFVGIVVKRWMLG